MTGSPEDPGRLLHELGDAASQIAFSKLYAFTDLSRHQLGSFSAAWERLATDQRRRILRRMAELAELSYRVSFGAVFRLTLDDSDADVRATAVEALWEDESPDLIGPFIRLLRSDPSPQVREAAAKGLGRFVLAAELEKLEPAIQQRIITELLTVLHLPSETSRVRRRALESVSYACTSEVTDALRAAYDDDDETMQIGALVGMGRTCDRRWEAILQQELRSPLAARRYEAALACGEQGLGRAVQPLSRLLDDSDREVVFASIWALGQIGGREARDALLAAYDDGDDDERNAIDDALAENALSSGDLPLGLYEPGELAHLLNTDDLLEDDGSDDADVDRLDADAWDLEDS